MALKWDQRKSEREMWPVGDERIKQTLNEHASRKKQETEEYMRNIRGRRTSVVDRLCVSYPDMNHNEETGTAIALANSGRHFQTDAKKLSHW